MASEWRALRVGESASERRLLLERVHEAFITEARGTLLLAGGTVDEAELRRRFAEFAQLRPVVFESWLRSLRIDPDGALDQSMIDDAELEHHRGTHPLGRVLPVVRKLLFEEAEEAGLVVAVGDAAGRLLWVEGDRKLRARGEELGFRAGIDWSEGVVGTTAPGSAIRLDHSIQVMGAEHYNRAVHQWSCTAAPVHDPTNGSIVGVIDVTGGDAGASPHVLPLVEATLAAVEAELKLESLRAIIGQAKKDAERARTIAIGAPRQGDGNSRDNRADIAPRLVVLGRDPALLEHRGESFPLSRRHAEILLALASSLHGVTAQVLAERVYGSAGAEPNLRPEMVRLRKWLARQGLELELLSRPYRLSGALRVDAFEALDAIGRGAHRVALAAYEGPVLPGSAAPLVEEVRREVDVALREAMLQSAAADLLFDYAQNWAEDDPEVWQTLLQVLPPLSPKRSRVVARLGALVELEYAMQR